MGDADKGLEEGKKQKIRNGIIKADFYTHIHAHSISNMNYAAGTNIITGYCKIMHRINLHHCTIDPK